jgi:molecular chaperone GrpE (heat shock protein)
MSDLKAPKLAKWPFFLGDALLLGMAYYIFHQCKFVLGPWELCFVFLSLAGGTLLCIAPFWLEYNMLVKLAEASSLTTVVSQMGSLEGIAGQISGATGRWQEAQDAADKTANSAKEIAERMTVEVQAFTEFMKRANDSERANLRLEVEKLRRAEADWLQVLVHLLDHVFALHAGALRSGQPGLIEQVGHFQNACRDTARRVGLTPFAANEAEPFDAKRHQLLEEAAPPAPGAVVEETIAAGYTFQGRLIRPALVRLREAPAIAAAPATEAAPTAQSSLPLGASDLGST